ncbi:MAG: GIY-YIG nuclease family protein [Sphingomonadales bacterium]|nr:MAG: GIY-YIG nuclease family protein [Sphingomonadales bacterium]
MRARTLGQVEKVTPTLSKSERIRQLAKEGVSTADIARTLGIRYQHAYKVLKDAGRTSIPKPKLSKPAKPILPKSILLASGFVVAAEWKLIDADTIVLSTALPKCEGVYAFSIDNVIQYVGVATMGLAKRIYFYAKPGISQRTSLRLNSVIRELLATGKSIEILYATPDHMEWNGLPVHGSAGLELGLIKTYSLPWNQRSSK